MKRQSAAIVLVVAVLTLAGCSTSDNGQDVGETNQQSGSLPGTPGANPPVVGAFHALFAPAGGLLPYPYTDGNWV
jgi:uncharacterized lipoprotein